MRNFQEKRPFFPGKKLRPFQTEGTLNSGSRHLKIMFTTKKKGKQGIMIIPEKKLSADFVVVGGGLAGICAAVVAVAAITATIVCLLRKNKD